MTWDVKASAARLLRNRLFPWLVIITLAVFVGIGRRQISSLRTELKIVEKSKIELTQKITSLENQQRKTKIVTEEKRPDGTVIISKTDDETVTNTKTNTDSNRKEETDRTTDKVIVQETKPAGPDFSISGGVTLGRDLKPSIILEGRKNNLLGPIHGGVLVEIDPITGLPTKGGLILGFDF